MAIFTALFLNLLPLYILIAVGFVAGRHFEVDRQSLANLALFVFLPVVVFGFVADLDLKPAYTALPVLIYAIQAIIGLGTYAIAKKFYATGDNRPNLLGMLTSMGNSGYFGLPLVILLFSEQWIGVYMFMLLGVTMYEATIGYYLAARSAFNVRDSLIKLCKFPSIYAIVLALIVNVSNVPLPDLFYTYWGYFKGAYIIVGMMIIGTALAKIEKLVIGWRFMGLAFAGKFILWPAVALTFIALDASALHLFEENIHKMILIMAIVPPAANIAAFAAQMNVSPEKAATTVLIGTLVALFYIPLIIAFTG